MDVTGIAGTNVLAHLADCFEERRAFNIANGAPDLANHDIDVVVITEFAHPGLDFVRDVGDHLNRRTEIVPPPLLANHRLVDRTRREVGVTPQRHTNESLVVAEVKIGFPAVIGNKHFAVLKRVHRARIDIDVRVELLDDNAQSTALEDSTERGPGNSLTEARCDPACDEDVLGQRTYFHLGLLQLSRNTRRL